MARLPPLISGGVPLVGHAVEFLKEPLDLLARGYQEGGEIFSLRLGRQSAVVLLGPEHNHLFFEETDRRLSIREAYPFMSRMFDEGFFFFAEPEQYLRQRNLIIQRFQGRQMTSYVSVMALETTQLITRLGEAGEFDLIPTLGPLVMNIAAHAFLGADFRHWLGGSFFALFRDFSNGMDPIIPGWLPLPRIVRSHKARAQLHAMIGDLIAARRRQPADPPDFLQALVTSHYPDGSAVPDMILIHLILLLVWAGHETTAGQVSWGLIDLLQHPEALERVRANQHEVLGDTLDLDAAEARRLQQIEWALKETERLHPVAFILMRLVQEELVVDDFSIPPGTILLLTPWFSHRLQEVYPDPARYLPERHDPARAEAPPYSLIGFGGGAHRCAGVNFAYQEMKVVITLLLQAFDLELVDPAPRPVAGSHTKWPASPCRVRYRRRVHARV